MDNEDLKAALLSYTTQCDMLEKVMTDEYNAQEVFKTKEAKVSLEIWGKVQAGEMTNKQGELLLKTEIFLDKLEWEKQKKLKAVVKNRKDKAWEILQVEKRKDSIN